MSAKSHTNTVLLPEKLILWGSIFATLVLVQLPYEKVDGKPVPAVLFKNKPSLFVVYILSLNFSVFGSFTTISLRERYPRLGRYCLFLAVVSMAIGIAILAWLSVPSPFNLVAARLRVY